MFLFASFFNFLNLESCAEVLFYNYAKQMHTSLSPRKPRISQSPHLRCYGIKKINYKIIKVNNLDRRRGKV